MKVRIQATATGFIIDARSETLGSYLQKRVVTHQQGIELWSSAMRQAANYDPEVIIWKGFPDLDQAIREYVNAGGKL